MRPIRRLLLSGLPLVLTTRYLGMFVSRSATGSLLLLEQRLRSGLRRQVHSQAGAWERGTDQLVSSAPMRPIQHCALPAVLLCSIFASPMRAEPTPAERVADIQKAL